MDFFDALTAHVQWKRRLSSSAFTPAPGLCLGLVASAEECELGQWLAGEGSKFACLPEFASLLASHARFHQAASDIMSKAGFGQPATHDIDPLAECDFIEASNEIARARVAMLKKMLVAQ